MIYSPTCINNLRHPWKLCLTPGFILNTFFFFFALLNNIIIRIASFYFHKVVVINKKKKINFNLCLWNNIILHNYYLLNLIQTEFVLYFRDNALAESHIQKKLIDKFYIRKK